MRIISGLLKSRRITAPKNLPVRPTTDLSKESLFNVLNNHFNFSEITVLDLFTGTGNISYEFGSRGCKDITSVDIEIKCTKFVIDTTKSFDLPIHVIRNDVFKFLESTKSSFDLIFADPPYNMSEDLFLKMVNLIFEKNILSDEGMLVVEHAKQTKFDTHPHLSFQKKYGGSVFSFFERKEIE